jgi:ligand-binding sensor domain-containing protein/two-component sensor histidine kinase
MPRDGPCGPAETSTTFNCDGIGLVPTSGSPIVLDFGALWSHRIREVVLEYGASSASWPYRRLCVGDEGFMTRGARNRLETLIASRKAVCTVWRPVARIALLICLSQLLPLALSEQLAVRVYGTTDGLPSNNVNCTVRDSRGFLWFCTAEGLSRFDGYSFTNYGVEHGLADRVVTDFLETKHGEYWVGTSGGVALFNPKPGPKNAMFTTYGAGEIVRLHALEQDVNGHVWIGADSGLFELVPSNGAWSLKRFDEQPGPRNGVEVLLEDHQGNLWIAVNAAPDGELWRRGADGKLERFDDPFFRGNRITSLTQDRQERIWLSSYHGLGLLVAHPQPGQRVVRHIYADWHSGRSDAGPVFQSSDGRLWVWAYGTREILTDAKGGIHFRMSDPKGFGYAAEDREGNLWMGPYKYAHNGLVTYGREDGLETEDIRSIFAGNDGSLYEVTGINNRYIHRLDGTRFVGVGPKVPGHEADWNWGGWGWGQTHLQDHEGEWWVATGYGLLRYPKVKRLEDLARTAPKAFYQKPRDIFRLYEDSRGDVWIAAWDGSVRWERSSGRTVPFGLGFPEPTAFREDGAGNVWIGHWDGGLSRYRDGKLEWIVRTGSFPTGMVLSLFLDHAGRLWAGTTRSGLVRIDNPSAERPTLKVYSTKDGLSSNDVRAITEDHYGRIYFWTGRSVDRLNPETGAIRHYTEADGLVRTGSDHNVAFCDRLGRLWFGLEGLSRLDPEPDPPSQPPTIRITKLKIRGVEYPISELGETNVSDLVLQPNQNQVQIEFASLNFATADLIKYQYKLEGAGNDWTPASDVRIVNYPSLTPGSYRFLVRAINADGMVSPVPAAVGLRLLPPLWMRWWFLTAASLLALYIVFQIYRYRVHHLLELERVRTRIATDLHDDIGSSLTQIAIMSEVARKQSQDSPAAGPLEHIADLSRGLVDSMSDIVWAINPKRDQLADLAQRMRRFAGVVLDAADLELDFRAPHEWADTALSADVRREVFLIFKEGVNNVVRHAKCRHVSVLVDLSRGQLRVELRDDGRGFQAEESDGHGHGLANMRTRAGRLGGKLEIASVPGQGTTVTLSVPLGRASRVRRFAS